MKRNPLFFTMLSIATALSLAAVFSAARPQSADELLKQGDELYARGNDAGALEAYLAAVKADPGRFEALWKASRSLVDNGDLADSAIAGREDRQKKLYQDAAEYARKAIAADPNSTWGYHHLSAALGKYGLTQGKREQVNMAKEVRSLIDKAIELDGTNDLAYHALGRWHRKMAEIGGAARLLGGLLFGGIPKGSFEESEAALKKAAELRPEFVNHHLELGRTYAALEKYKEAVAEFQRCLDLPAATTKDPGYKEEAAAELDKAKKEIKEGLRTEA
jgi:tetratricopeptide (TPR) repeat protein